MELQVELEDHHCHDRHIHLRALWAPNETTTIWEPPSLLISAVMREVGMREVLVATSRSDWKNKEERLV